jgi:hypothetical protein
MPIALFAVSPVARGIVLLLLPRGRLAGWGGDRRFALFFPDDVHIGIRVIRVGSWRRSTRRRWRRAVRFSSFFPLFATLGIAVNFLAIRFLFGRARLLILPSALEAAITVAIMPTASTATVTVTVPAGRGLGEHAELREIDPAVAGIEELHRHFIEAERCIGTNQDPLL